MMQRKIIAVKQFVLLFFFLTVYSNLHAQESSYWKTYTPAQVDSLTRLLANTTNDTLRLEVTRQLGIHYEEINRDSSLKYHEQRIQLARNLNQKLWEADALDATGWVLAEQKNYPKSLQYFLEAIKLLEDKDVEKNIWKLSTFAPDRDPEYVRLTSLAIVKNDYSQLYSGTGETQKELEYLFESLSIAKSVKNEGVMGLVHSNIAETYNTMGEADSAIVHGKAAFQYMQASSYTRYLGYALLTIGNAYVVKNDFEQGKKYLESALESDKKYSVAKLPDSYLSLAKLYQQLNDSEKTIQFAHHALYHSLKTKNQRREAEAYFLLYSIYNSRGKTDSAFYYLQQYRILSDNLNRIEKDRVYEYLNIGFNEQVKQQELEQAHVQKANQFRLYAILFVLAVMVLIAFLLLRNNRNRRKANLLLQQQKEKVETTLSELKATQSQLIQAEKMASLGELTAGIAHEIQNPLNFVNNFSEINTELIDELEQEVKKGNRTGITNLIKDVKDNEQKINHHGKRAGEIVKGMLQHSRTSSGQKELTDINVLADEYLRLAYHGLRAKDKSFNATLKTEYDESVGRGNIVPQDIGRVILNLITNAFYAVNEANTLRQAQGDSRYEPTVTIATSREDVKSEINGVKSIIKITVKDNGNGIPDKIRDKIFQPFFTTKPTGQGTGLGLSLSYDIVKSHGGKLEVETKEGEGTEFKIILPAS